LLGLGGGQRLLGRRDFPLQLAGGCFVLIGDGSVVERQEPRAAAVTKHDLWATRKGHSR
jgi:hypothetical protein